MDIECCELGFQGRRCGFERPGHRDELGAGLVDILDVGVAGHGDRDALIYMS